jgi:uncharacterized membrane protein
VIGGQLNLASSLSSLLNLTSVTLSSTVKTCLVKLLGACVSLSGPTAKNITINLASLVPAGSTLLALVGGILDTQLNPLLEALGIGVDPMEVEILDIHAGAPQLVI